MRQIDSHSAIVSRRLAQTGGLLICWVFAGGFAFTAAADDVSPQAEVEGSPDSEIEVEADELIAEAFAAREEVRTGRVRIAGRLTALSPDGEAVLDGPLTGLYVFDREEDLFRYQGEAPCRIVILEPGKAPLTLPDEVPTTQVPFGFCRSRDYFASWDEIGPNTSSGVNLYPFTMERDVWSLACWRKPLDVMAFGMHGYLSLERGWETVDAYGFWLDIPEHSVLEANEQTVTIELRRGDFVCTIVFDRDLMAPIQLDHGVISDPAQFQSTTEWQVVDGVSVPVKYSTRFTTPDAVEIFEAELEWLSVNEDIPDKEFEYTAFTGLTPKVHDVYDQRTDPVTRLGLWVGDGIVEPD